MSDAEEKKRPVYVMVPKSLITAALIGYATLFIGVIASFQYANYVDRRSNQRLCGVVVLSNQASIVHPSMDPLRQQIAAAMLQLQQDYKCK